MIIGVGNDIIEIDRVKKACENRAFLTRCFTENEIRELGDSIDSLAGNYAVKESVAKAFGTGFRGIELTEIEVLRNKLGAPTVNLYGNAEKLAKELDVKKVFVTISNLKDLVSAVVVLEGE